MLDGVPLYIERDIRGQIDIVACFCYYAEGTQYITLRFAFVDHSVYYMQWLQTEARKWELK